MQITPYLNFKGQCEAAFRFYEQVLGGQLTALMRFGEMPPGDWEPGPELRDQVMHAYLQLGDFALMGSDCPPEQFQQPAGTSVSISVDDASEGRRIFQSLAEGGSTTMDYAETFWAEGFGMCVDRFGTPWMVNAGSKDPEG